MIAWLLIADPPEQSAEQLAESLHASRGAISQNTRVLVQMGLVQRVRKPGERRDYFRIRPGAWEQSTRERRHETRKYTQLFQRGLALTEGGSPESQRALKESIEFMTFLDQEVDALFERWDQRKGTSS
jgi:DNA-binding transcriptional regulator GbsR (MarR family)